MYRFLLIIYSLLISLTMSAYEHTYPDLNDLDAILNRHNAITLAKIQSIESKKYILVNTDSMTERYNICDSLFHDYSSFQLDSALSYANRKLKIAKQLQDRKHIDRSIIEMANMYIQAGMNMQSYELLQQLDRSQLDPALLQDYYSINNNLYEFLSQFALNKTVRDGYKQTAKAYRDSVLMHEPNDMFVYTYSLLSDGKYQKGLPPGG